MSWGVHITLTYLSSTGLHVCYCYGYAMMGICKHNVHDGCMDMGSKFGHMRDGELWVMRGIETAFKA